MMEWSTACVDWRERVVDRRSLIPFDPLFPAEADYALSIFKSLRISDLPGKPTFGEACEQWVFDFVAAIFGAYDAENGAQLINEFLLLISKKNTKSTIAAGIMLTALIINWREDEELLILAPTIEIAQNSYKPAAAMVRESPELAALMHVQDHIRTITHRVTKAALKVVAADTDTVSGKKAGRILVDELWIFGSRANAPQMLMEATGGLVSRPEGFVIYLSTQSDKPPEGVFKTKLRLFRSIRDGQTKDNRKLGVIYEFPEDMVKRKAYLDPENFYVTNPNLGRSVSQGWIEGKIVEHTMEGDAVLLPFLAKHLNIEIGQGQSLDGWAGAQFWAAAADKTLSLESLLDRCDVAVCGVDGGGLDDLLALTVIGRERVTRRWLCWSHAWAHALVLDRRKSEAAKLRDLEQAGELTIYEEPGADVDGLVMYVCQVEDAGLLPAEDAVGMDPMGVGAYVDALAEAGIEGERRVVGVPQGYRLSKSIWTTERKLADGSFIHGGQQLMAWAVGNAKTESRGNAVLITKAVAGRAKIDPLMSTFNAVALMTLNPEASSSASIYNDEAARPSGLMVI